MKKTPSTSSLRTIDLHHGEPVRLGGAKPVVRLVTESEALRLQSLHALCLRVALVPFDLRRVALTARTGKLLRVRERFRFIGEEAFVLLDGDVRVRSGVVILTPRV